MVFEDPGQIQRLVCCYRQNPYRKPEYPTESPRNGRLLFSLPYGRGGEGLVGYYAYHIVNQEHLQQHPGKPVTVLGGALHGPHETVLESAVSLEYDKQAQEDKGRHYLHHQLLQINLCCHNKVSISF